MFVNDLPLGLIELKNAAVEDATIWSACTPLQTDKAEVPTLLHYNAALVVSDGLRARNRAIAMQEVIEELIKLAKALGLSDDEIAFCDALAADALAANESAVQAMGDDKLRRVGASAKRVSNTSMMCELSCSHSPGGVTTTGTTLAPVRRRISRMSHRLCIWLSAALTAAASSARP